MRHPAAPAVVAVLLGFLTLLHLWTRLRRDSHHEGNPHPDQVMGSPAGPNEPGGAGPGGPRGPKEKPEAEEGGT